MKFTTDLRAVAIIVCFGASLCYAILNPNIADGALSWFYHDLKQAPIVWWSGPRLWSVWLISGCFIASIFAAIVLKYPRDRILILIPPMVALPCLIIGLLIDSFGGTALYADRIIHANSNRLDFVAKTHWYKDVHHIEVSCHKTRKKINGHYQDYNRMGYWLVINDQKVVDLAEKLNEGAPPLPLLSAISDIDKQLHNQGLRKIRALDQQDAQFQSCMKRYLLKRQSADRDTQALATLFHLSSVP